jgi:hypothetical protein
MSALTRPEYHSDEPSRYAPKWIREAHLRPSEPVGRLPRAAQFGPREASNDTPVVSWPQEHSFEDQHPEPVPEREHAAFEGDVAIRQMREARVFEPQEVPEPRWNEPPKLPLSMLLRTSVAIGVATLGALVYVGIVPLAVPSVVQELVSSMRQTTAATTASRPSAVERPTKLASRFGDEASAGERAGATPAADTPAAGPASDGTRAVRTVTVAPWPVAATPQPAAATPQPAAAPQQTAAPAASSAPAGVTRRLDADEIDSLIQRGEAFILQGDFAAARLMLQRAAEAGSARAAVTLGATYDPVMLRKVGVVGFKAEPALAREWYERAASLGSPEASSRIAELGKN